MRQPFGLAADGHAHHQRVLRVAQEHDGRPVARIHDHAVAPLQHVQRARHDAVEAPLDLVLLGDRVLGVPDDVQEQHAAYQRAPGFLGHGCPVM